MLALQRPQKDNQGLEPWAGRWGCHRTLLLWAPVPKALDLRALTILGVKQRIHVPENLSQSLSLTSKSWPGSSPHWDKKKNKVLSKTQKPIVSNLSYAVLCLLSAPATAGPRQHPPQDLCTCSVPLLKCQLQEAFPDQLIQNHTHAHIHLSMLSLPLPCFLLIIDQQLIPITLYLFIYYFSPQVEWRFSQSICLMFILLLVNSCSSFNITNFEIYSYLLF